MPLWWLLSSWWCWFHLKCAWLTNRKLRWRISFAVILLLTRRRSSVVDSKPWPEPCHPRRAFTGFSDQTSIWWCSVSYLHELIRQLAYTYEGFTSVTETWPEQSQVLTFSKGHIEDQVHIVSLAEAIIISRTDENGSTRWSDAHKVQLSIMSHISLWKVATRMKDIWLTKSTKLMTDQMMVITPVWMVTGLYVRWSDANEGCGKGGIHTMG